MPFAVSHPSRRIKGVKTNAATGSAQPILHMALRISPASAIHAMYPHKADCAASARNDPLAVAPDSLRFCRASQGITTLAVRRRPMPRRLGRVSICPIRLPTEATSTNAASKNSSPAAICADVFWVWSRVEGDRKCQSTTHADSSSIPLSPPNARSAGLCALHALIPETISSRNIQKIVNH